MSVSVKLGSRIEEDSEAGRDSLSCGGIGRGCRWKIEELDSDPALDPFSVIVHS